MSKTLTSPVAKGLRENRDEAESVVSGWLRYERARHPLRTDAEHRETLLSDMREEVRSQILAGYRERRVETWAMYARRAIMRLTNEGSDR